jgi:PST family polysaccharide transporter
MSSYKEIAKSTGLIACVKIFTILFGIVRVKAIAILLGTAGFGYYSIFAGFAEMFSAITTLGVDQSGVREIARSYNSEDKKQIALTRNAIKFSIYFFMMISCLVAVIFSKRLSGFLFGTESYSLEVIIVSLGAVFTCIARGQMAVLNGLRQIRYLAYCQIIGAIAGSLGAILFVYLLREKGIPWAISLVSVSLFLSTLYYEKKNIFVKVESVALRSYYLEITRLLGLGLSLCISGVMAAVVANFSMIFLREELGIEVVGLYQSSWTISNLYIGIILGAMGVDFMPRLMGVITDNLIVSKKVNEQIQIGVLVGSTGVLITFLFAPVILQLLYSTEFSGAGSIMRWHSLGIALRVVAWPLAFVITAKGKGLIYVVVQFMFQILEYTLLVLFVKLYGEHGLGINYLIAYGVYLLLVFLACRYLVSFSFDRFTKQLIGIVFIFLVGAIISVKIIPGTIQVISSIILLLLNCLWVNYILKNKMSIDMFTFLRHRMRKS